MLGLKKYAFDAEAFFANAGPGRTIVKLGEKQTLFSQGVAVDSVFYLQMRRRDSGAQGSAQRNSARSIARRQRSKAAN